MSKFKKLLLNRQKELLALDASTQEDTKPVALDQQAIGRVSRIDSIQVKAMSEAQAARRKQELIRIKAALQRIENDEFGYCVTCGEEIAEKRLALDPSTPFCTDCAK